MIKILKSSVVVILFSITTISIQAQNEIDKPNVTNPPVNLETMVGSRGVMYQLLLSKKFQSVPKLGVFSITTGAGSWEKEIVPDIMTQTHLTYNLFKGLDVSAGMQYTPIYGFRPVAGLIYSYATKNLLFIANPKIDLADDLATEYMSLLEYRPRINDKFNLYSRVQGLYGFVTESGDHNRSYIMLRAGLSYKEFTFGAASNFDWYGPVKHQENNFGVFVSALLF